MHAQAGGWSTSAPGPWPLAPSDGVRRSRSVSPAGLNLHQRSKNFFCIRIIVNDDATVIEKCDIVSDHFSCIQIDCGCNPLLRYVGWCRLGGLRYVGWCRLAGRRFALSTGSVASVPTQ